MGGVFSLLHCALLDITKDLASCVSRGTGCSESPLLAHYAILRKEAQARSIHPLHRRQIARDVGRVGLF